MKAIIIILCSVFFSLGSEQSLSGFIDSLTELLVKSVKSTDSSTILLIPFEGEENRDEKEFLTILIENSLQKREEITLVDRSLLKKILSEQNLTNSDLSNERVAIELGQMISATYICQGRYSKSFGAEIVSIKLISVESSEIVSTVMDELPLKDK